MLQIRLRILLTLAAASRAARRGGRRRDEDAGGDHENGQQDELHRARWPSGQQRAARDHRRHAARELFAYYLACDSLKLGTTESS